MSEVGVIWARAPTLEKLEKELFGLLDGYCAEDVLGVSHSAASISSRQSGGIWGGASQSYKLEYSAVVMVRAR